MHITAIFDAMEMIADMFYPGNDPFTYECNIQGLPEGLRITRVNLYACRRQYKSRSFSGSGMLYAQAESVPLNFTITLTDRPEHPLCL